MDGKRYIVFEVTLDEETGYVTDFSMTEGVYNRATFVEEDMDDKPISVNEATRIFNDELGYFL